MQRKNKIKIKIVSIFPRNSALWNYCTFLSKNLSKNKRFNIEFIDLTNTYQGNIKRAINLMKGIDIKPSDVLILGSPLLASTFKKSKAELKIVIAYDLYPITMGTGVSPLIKILVKNTYKNMKYADIIVPISEFCKNEIIKIYGLKKKLHVIHGGIDHNIFKRIKKNKKVLRKSLNFPDKTLLLHIGRDDYRKNFRFVLNMLKKLKNKVLIKVGNISRSDVSYIRLNKLEGKIINIKNIEDKKLNIIYNASDILLFPSFYEGLGMPPIEAMACGLPTIVAKNTGLREVGIAESFEKLDLNKWQEKIEKILKNEKFRNKMIQKGLKQSKNFDWVKYAEKIEKIILHNV